MFRWYCIASLLLAVLVPSEVLGSPKKPPPDAATLDRFENLKRAGLLEEAEEVLRAGLDAAPTSWALKEALGVFLFSRRRLEDAEPLLAAVCSERPVERGCSALAGYYLSRGEWRKARDLASSVSVSCAGSRRLTLIASIESDKPDLTGAQRLVEEDGQHEMSYLILASFYWTAGDKTRALEALQQGRRIATRVILLNSVKWAPIPASKKPGLEGRKE